MSYLCLILFLLKYKHLSFDFADFKFEYESIVLILLFVLLLSGMILSFYHAFSTRRKTLIEKKLMIIFAGILCGFSGIWGGTFMLLNSPTILTVFPIWNIFCGWVLLGALRVGELSEKHIRDENLKLNEVISATVILSIVFSLCYLIFKLNWATTFSICITWVTTVNKRVNSILIKQQIIKY